MTICSTSVLEYFAMKRDADGLGCEVDRVWQGINPDNALNEGELSLADHEEVQKIELPHATNAWKTLFPTLDLSAKSEDKSQTTLTETSSPPPAKR